MPVDPLANDIAPAGVANNAAVAGVANNAAAAGGVNNGAVAGGVNNGAVAGGVNNGAVAGGSRNWCDKAQDFLTSNQFYFLALSIAYLAIGNFYCSGLTCHVDLGSGADTWRCDIADESRVHYSFNWTQSLINGGHVLVIVLVSLIFVEAQWILIKCLPTLIVLFICVALAKAIDRLSHWMISLRCVLGIISRQEQAGSTGGGNSAASGNNANNAINATRPSFIYRCCGRHVEAGLGEFAFLGIFVFFLLSTLVLYMFLPATDGTGGLYYYIGHAMHDSMEVLQLSNGVGSLYMCIYIVLPMVITYLGRSVSFGSAYLWEGIIKPRRVQRIGALNGLRKCTYKEYRDAEKAQNAQDCTKIRIDPENGLLETSGGKGVASCCNSNSNCRATSDPPADSQKQNSTPLLGPMPNSNSSVDMDALMSSSSLSTAEVPDSSSSGSPVEPALSPENPVPNEDPDGEPDECPICMDSFAPTDELVFVCEKHFFHTDCITLHANMHTGCPLCRREAFSIDIASRHELWSKRLRFLISTLIFCKQMFLGCLLFALVVRLWFPTLYCGVIRGNEDYVFDTIFMRDSGSLKMTDDYIYCNNFSDANVNLVDYFVYNLFSDRSKHTSEANSVPGFPAPLRKTPNVLFWKWKYPGDILTDANGNDVAAKSVAAVANDHSVTAKCIDSYMFQLFGIPGYFGLDLTDGVLGTIVVVVSMCIWLSVFYSLMFSVLMPIHSQLHLKVTIRVSTLTEQWMTRRNNG